MYDVMPQSSVGCLRVVANLQYVLLSKSLTYIKGMTKLWNISGKETFMQHRCFQHAVCWYKKLLFYYKCPPRPSRGMGGDPKETIAQGNPSKRVDNIWNDK